jgi:MFS family permease
MMVQMAAANTLIQTMVDEDKRGRVMSYFGMAFQGAAPFGSLLAGWLAGPIGVRAVVAGWGALVLLGALTFATQLPRLRRRSAGLILRLERLAHDHIGLALRRHSFPQILADLASNHLNRAVPALG